MYIYIYDKWKAKHKTNTELARDTEHQTDKEALLSSTEVNTWTFQDPSHASRIAKH